MGQNESKELLESEETKTLRQISERGGPTAVEEYIKKNLNRWKTEKVKFAVTGRTATGKSSFINALRNLDEEDEGLARTGAGNITKEPTPYEDPKNPQIIYYDLPGFATLSFKKDTYVKDMRLYDYDYFLIFFDKVINEDEYWVITQLNELNKKFCLVRSKIDEDIKNAKYDRIKISDVLPNIREKIEKDLELLKFSLLKNSKSIFLLSSRNKSLGDIDALLSHMEANLSSRKFEAIMYSLKSISKNTIEKKYDMLKKRMMLVTALTAGVAAVSEPSVDFAMNKDILVHEIQHYINVFGLTQSNIKTLDELILNQLKCTLLHPSIKDLSSLVVAQLGTFAIGFAIDSVLDNLIPVIGSVISAGTTAVIVYRYLTSVLNDIRDDSYLVFGHIRKKERQ